MKEGKTYDGLSVEEFADRMCELLPRMMRGLITQEKNYFSRGLITMPQLQVLQLLSEGEQFAMRDIGRALGLKPSTITGLADRLVRMGLVRRFSTEADRRTVLACLTPKGRRILTHMREEKKRTMMTLFARTTGEERALHLAMTEKLLSQIPERGKGRKRGRK